MVTQFSLICPSNYARMYSTVSSVCLQHQLRESTHDLRPALTVGGGSYLRYEPQWSWREHWYAGGQYRFLRTKSSLRRNPQFDASVISLAELDLRTASLGPRVTRD